jgi:DNA repair exonuclease SbcCD ATPase subunit
MQQAVYEIRVNLEHYRHLLEEEKQATQNTTGAAEELAQVRLELFTALDHYAEVYQIDLYQHPGIETELLEILTKDVALYREYLEECRQKDQADKVMEEQRHLLDDYLKRFPIEATLSVAEGLKCVQTNRQRYGQLQEEISNQKKELRKFRRETQVEKNTVSVEELQVQQEKLDQEIREINRGITQDNETLLQLTEELDQIEDAEMRRDVLTEEKTDCLKKVDLLIKTEEFLQMAREQFLSSYMKPLRQGLDRYMSLLDDRYFDVTAAMDLDITMDLSIQIHSHGTTQSGEYLSRGYQDLAALCARFALVDVLYRKEQPVIILDDPLTNLDGDKVSRGLQLLQKISENRQIIYFTCHDSRMP